MQSVCSERTAEWLTDGCAVKNVGSYSAELSALGQRAVLVPMCWALNCTDIKLVVAENGISDFEMKKQAATMATEATDAGPQPRESLYLLGEMARRALLTKDPNTGVRLVIFLMTAKLPVRIPALTGSCCATPSNMQNPQYFVLE